MKNYISFPVQLTMVIWNVYRESAFLTFIGESRMIEYFPEHQMNSDSIFRWLEFIRLIFDSYFCTKTNFIRVTISLNKRQLSVK